MLNLGAGLEGRTVVVTGGAGGIGREVAKAFAQVGAKVLVVDIDQPKVDSVVAELEGEGHLGMAMDLTDLASHAAIVDEADRRMGGIFVLAHLAAVLRRRPSLDEITEDDWDFQMDTNLKATFFLARTVAQSMIRHEFRGRIVLYTSQGWWTGGFGGSVVYASSKGGIVSMSRGLARSLGGKGITVNTVAPAQVETPMLLAGLDKQVYDHMREQTPLGYVAEPHELAGVTVFLASDHARYITGATINVSGGFLMY
jgi:NAD(P)-dependent dehydrogenase (short-subunit alcohol dehydrogenase family)